MNSLSDYKLKKLGKFSRTHAYKGALVLQPEFDFFIIPEGEPLFVLIDGIKVPFFLQDDLKVYKNAYLIKFDSLNNEKEAADFIGKAVFADEKYIDTDKAEHAYTEVVGFEVYDRERYIGTISSYLSSPVNPIWQVERPDGKEVLIPVEAPFLKKTDTKNRKLFFELPKGLYDLN